VILTQITSINASATIDFFTLFKLLVSLLRKCLCLLRVVPGSLHLAIFFWVDLHHRKDDDHKKHDPNHDAIRALHYAPNIEWSTRLKSTKRHTVKDQRHTNRLKPDFRVKRFYPFTFQVSKIDNRMLPSVLELTSILI